MGQTPLHYMSRTASSSQITQALLTGYRGNFKSQHFRRNCLYDISTGMEIMDLNANTHPAVTSMDEDLLYTIGYRSERAIDINFEIIIPWLFQNILKRCHNDVNELEEHVKETLHESSEIEVLLPSDIRYLFYRMSIVVTDDIIFELCRRYAADPNAIQRRMEADMLKAQSKGSSKRRSSFKKSKVSSSKMADDEDGTSDDDVKGEPLTRHSLRLNLERFQPKSADKDRGLDPGAIIADLRSGEAVKPVSVEVSANLAGSDALTTGMEAFRSALAPRWSRTMASVEAIHKSRRALVNLPDKNGRSALLFAAGTGNLAAVRALLDEGADVVVGSGEESPMSVACNGAIKAALERHFISLMTSGSIGSVLSANLPGYNGLFDSDRDEDEKHQDTTMLRGN